MDYKYQLEDYITLAKEYYELDKSNYSNEYQKNEFITELEKRTKRKKEIYEACNTLINECITKYKNNPDLLDNSYVQRLEKFFTELQKEKIDSTIQYETLLLIKDYYHRINDDLNYLKYLNIITTISSVLYATHSNIFLYDEFYNEILEINKRIDSLNSEELNHFLNALAFSYLQMPKGLSLIGKTLDYDQMFKTMNIIKSHLDIYDETKNSFYFRFLHNVLGLFSADCYYADIEGRKVDIDKIKPTMLEIINYLEDAIAKGQLFKVILKGMFSTVYIRTKYYLGLITLEEMLKEFDLLIDESIKDNNQMTIILGVPSINYNYLIFLNRYSKLSKEEIKKISKERIDKYLPLILSLTENIHNSSINFNIMLFVAAASYAGSFDDFSDTLLKYTIYSDKALYIHTEMVKEISLVIFDYLIKNNPECFNGVASKDISYIKNHKEKMRELLARCCMFHDAGKIFIFDLVENSMRRLTDLEYDFIKYHPLNFEDLYEPDLINTEEVRCIHDCALTHHLWHDGTNGYPKIKQTKNRPFSDILAIADAIDAATDFYGRPYRSPKLLEELIKEFKNGRGARYGESPVDALSDKNVTKEIQRIITDRRKEINYQIYCFNSIK